MPIRMNPLTRSHNGRVRYTYASLVDDSTIHFARANPEPAQKLKWLQEKCRPN